MVIFENSFALISIEESADEMNRVSNYEVIVLVLEIHLLVDKGNLNLLLLIKRNSVV